MRVIITGGTGLIGQALAHSFVSDGHQVIVLGRNPNKTSGLPAGVSVTQWDGRTANGWGHLVDGAGAIVNLAGSSIAGDGLFPDRWTAERRRAIKESRVNAGKAVIDALRAATVKPGVLIQPSGTDYYDSDGSETVTESSPTGDDFLADICRAWEDATREAEALGVRRAVTRMGVVLSRNGGALPRMSFPFQFFVGGPFGSGRQPVPWIHIDDVVGAMRFLIENPDGSGAFNLTAPNPVTNAEFSRALGQAMGRPSWLPIPGFAFKLAFGEVAGVVLEGDCVVPQRLLELGYAFKFPTVEAALADLYGAGEPSAEYA